MTSTYKKGGGRDVIVSLVESVATITGDGTITLEAGKWYVPTAIADGSEISDFKIGRPFMAKEGYILSVGDSAEELTDFWLKDNVIGFANSKSLSFSKNSFDVTVDYDETYDKITETQVEVSGSFDGFKLLGITSEDNAIAKVNRHFSDIVLQTADGNTTLEKTNDIEYLAFVYSKTKPKTGDVLDVTFVPVSLTSNAENSAYSSGHTQNISFEGSSKAPNCGDAVTSKSVVVY